MADKVWKVNERQVARRLGGQRIALSGGPGARSKADVLLPHHFVEVKRRKRWSAASWYGAAALKAAAEGLEPVLVVHVARTDLWLAVVSLSELARLIGTNQSPEAP